MEAVQSPIALQLRDAELVDDAVPLEFNGHCEKIGGFAEMINTGSSLMITFPNRHKKPYIIGGPLNEKYIFEQLHFHWVRFNGGFFVLLIFHEDILSSFVLPLNRVIAMISDVNICLTETPTAWRHILCITMANIKTFRKRLINRMD